jgi:hypothetical protein
MVFLVGATALAVDVSGFYQDARAEQTDADLTCLAGVPELPESPNTALTRAAEFAQRNWLALASVTPTITATQAILDDGNGNVVTITTPVDGQNTKMKVEVGKLAQAAFGKVLGAGSISVQQVAACQTFGLGSGTLPFGDLPGGMDQWLQNPDECGSDQGNCQRLTIERKPREGSNRTVAQNIAYGAAREVQVYNGVEGTCSGNGAVDPCNSIDTSTGNNDPQNTAGFLMGGNWGIGVGEGRLQNVTYSNPAKYWTFQGSQEDGDDPADVGTVSNPPGVAKPAYFDENINGPWDEVWYYSDLDPDGCSSPRIVRIPILVWEDEYAAWLAGTLPDPPGPSWPPGSKTMRVVGFHWAFLMDPDELTDLRPPVYRVLEKIEAVPLAFADDIQCVGPNAPTKPFEPGDPKVIRLVAP